MLWPALLEKAYAWANGFADGLTQMPRASAYEAMEGLRHLGSPTTSRMFSRCAA